MHCSLLNSTTGIISLSLSLKMDKAAYLEICTHFLVKYLRLGSGIFKQKKKHSRKTTNK